MISAEEHERVFHWLYDLSQNGPVRHQSHRGTDVSPGGHRTPQGRAGDGTPVTFQGAGFQYADGLNRPTKGVNDGNGFLFISHIGEIQPSGFLPLTAGNVRTDDVVDVYRHSQLFTDLRRPELIKGRCGICEYRDVCGGQRGRAYGITGDYLETDPACSYIPKGA